MEDLQQKGKVKPWQRVSFFPPDKKGLGQGPGPAPGAGGVGVCCLPGGPSLAPALEAACGAARGGLTGSRGWREGAELCLPWAFIFP